MSFSLVPHRSLIAFAVLATSLAASQVYAQPRPAPRPRMTVPPPPDVPAVPDLPDFPDLPDLPDLPDVSLTLPIEPFMIAQAIAPKVAVLTNNNLYQQARDLIENGQYDRAVSQLNRLIAQFDGKPIADSTANRVDAAFYWKAYAQSKQKNLADAQATLQELQKKFADSRWLKDAKALEVEVRQASGQAVSPDGQPDDDLKLLALRGLMQSDPERAVPMVEQILSGNSSIKVKENALFVLSQSRSARAHEILGNVAKGGSNPDLQMKAIRYLGAMGGPDNAQILDEAYRATSDEAVKRAIIRSFMIRGDRTRLAGIANDANSAVPLRAEAIQQLGILRANDELARLYARETSPELKQRILQGLFIGGDAGKLVELARAEKDLDVKKDIVRKLSLMKSKEATDYMLELLK